MPTVATDAAKTTLLPPVPTVEIATDGALPSNALPSASSNSDRPSNASVEIVPVDFNGVTLGETTVEEMIGAWGKPVEQAEEHGTLRCRFVIEPFASVDVHCTDGKAESIIVDLGEAFTTDAVVRELGLGDVRPVDVRDETGRLLGLIYPERGVSFRFNDGAADRRVTFIGLDRIDARPFVLRAEQRIETDYTLAAADLQTALKLDAENGRALWLKARMLQAVGRRREALEAVEAALKQEPKGAEYLLTRAGLLAETGLFTAAEADAAAVIDGTAAVPHLQAQAWCLRGDLFAARPDRDYGQALDAHTRAVRLAEPMVADNRLVTRRTAKQTMIEAHLGVAEDIAWGEWQKKELIVPQWLDKAVRLAGEWSKQGDLPSDMQLMICRRAAGCYVGMQGTGDPAVWAERLRAIAAGPIADPQADPTLRRHRQWECGLGLYDCLQAFHARGEVAEALRCGEQAVELLTAGREGRDPLPTDAYMFGRLYFRIGSIYAVKRQDHAKAVEWFDRAAPLLERPLPEAVAADRGRQGETLVSMGVSYWAVGKRPRAMELTNAGGRYMQAAVDAGSLKPDALAVPYANLAAMHRQLGDDAAGKKFAEMASRAEANGGLRR
jgi:tetratricopeptide (TPR) repeat protein